MTFAPNNSSAYFAESLFSVFFFYNMCFFLESFKDALMTFASNNKYLLSS